MVFQPTHNRERCSISLKPIGGVVYVDSTYFVEMFMEIYCMWKSLWQNRRVARTQTKACVVVSISLTTTMFAQLLLTHQKYYCQRLPMHQNPKVMIRKK